MCVCVCVGGGGLSRCFFVVALFVCVLISLSQLCSYARCVSSCFRKSETPLDLDSLSRMESARQTNRRHTAWKLPSCSNTTWKLHSWTLHNISLGVVWESCHRNLLNEFWNLLGGEGGSSFLFVLFSFSVVDVLLVTLLPFYFYKCPSAMVVASSLFVRILGRMLAFPTDAFFFFFKWIWDHAH